MSAGAMPTAPRFHWYSRSVVIARLLFFELKDRFAEQNACRIAEAEAFLVLSFVCG